MPDGLCECGCGGATTIARATVTKYGWVKGQAKRFIHGHHTRLPRPKRSNIKSYREIGGRVLHRVRAEKALGHRLPIGAIVHHADGTKNDDSPLVILQNNTEHFALHRRMRIQAAGGNPWTDLICGTCKRVKAKSEFSSSRNRVTGRHHSCRECEVVRLRDYAIRIKSEKAVQYAS